MDKYCFNFEMKAFLSVSLIMVIGMSSGGILPTSSLSWTKLKNNDRGDWVKTFSLDLNPYDPIARVAISGNFWRKILGSKLKIAQSSFVMPNLNYFEAPSTSTTTTPTTIVAAPTMTWTQQQHPTMNQGPQTTTSTKSPPLKPTTSFMMSIMTKPSASPTSVTKPTPSPMTRPTPSAMTMTSSLIITNMTIAGVTTVTPKPLMVEEEPSTDQLLKCIDWLLDWIQANSTLRKAKKPEVDIIQPQLDFLTNTKTHRNRNRLSNFLNF